MYIPMFVLVLLGVWWFLIRPVGLAKREQQEKLQREHERARELEEKRQGLKKLETFHWQETRMGGDMIVSVDVHFPTMRMHVDTTSRYGNQAETFEVRRKLDGTWEQRQTSEMQLASVNFIKRLGEKAEYYERLSEDQRSQENSPYVETHGLLQETEWSLDGIDRAADRVRKNEWWPLNGDLAPQIEFQYQRLMKC